VTHYHITMADVEEAAGVVGRILAG